MFSTLSRQIPLVLLALLAATSMGVSAPTYGPDGPFPFPPPHPYPSPVPTPPYPFPAPHPFPTPH
jgi:hypothetical protein